MKRPAVHDLLRLKGTRKFLEMHVDDEDEAAAAQEAGIEILTCEIDAKLPLIRKAAPFVFIQASGLQKEVCSASDGIRSGFTALEMGADAFYFAGSLGIVEAMAKEGIPVTGHIGLVPRRAAWTGYRAVGKTVEEAVSLYRRMKDLENAGAFAVEIEVVPIKIADFLTRNTTLLTEGMGCGTACDTQYLFSSDVLGTNDGHYPRHAKKYADIPQALRDVQRQRVKAFRDFADDVGRGGYPQARHCVDVDDRVVEEFRALIS